MSRPSPPSPRERLLDVRRPLLELHRVLLEDERRRYEQVHGRVAPAELLQLALSHEQFAWLHRISAVIVRVDELMASEDGPGVREVEVLAEHVRQLLRPSPDGSTFEQHYDRAVQSDPAILLAHRAVVQALPPGSQLPSTVH